MRTISDKEFDSVPTLNGYLDCDDPDGLDFAHLMQVLDYVKTYGGNVPSDFQSWQDVVFPGQEQRAIQMVSTQLLHDLQEKVELSGLDLAALD